MKKIEKVPLLITKSDNVEGMLTLQSANKYKIGIIESINFKTFCAINNPEVSFDSRYVILTKTDTWLPHYIEPFTSERVTETDKRIIRCASNYIDLVFTGNDLSLEEITLSQLGQIFPDNKSLEEYKTLFHSFYKENKNAFYEVKKIKEEEKTYSSKNINNAPNSKRGMEIYESLLRQKERVDGILNRIYEGIDNPTPKKIYTIKNK